MTNSITHHAVAFSFAAFVTLGVLFGLNGLASSKYQSAHELAQATAELRA
ncbi:hypothetical protein HLB44_20310 [Aquincola sp. S2]|uniref:Uncharacterized protein n=1 Tax=Pseudaquabacterium terrae TaxID=2732868 RepID=A0ABX2EL66_9BURK|nr:hypothetical protein [Aquabacterium terrae]NRF69346.1 hypothetical protein [Aquabacterium terrae]